MLKKKKDETMGTLLTDGRFDRVYTTTSAVAGAIADRVSEVLTREDIEVTVDIRVEGKDERADT